MLRVVAVLLVGILVVDAYKILVYSPKFGHSHSNYMGRIADILSEAGHNISTIVSVIDPEVADGTKLSNIIKVQPSDATTKMYAEMTKTKADMFEMNNFNPIGAYFMGKFFGDLFAAQCRALLEEPGLVEKLKAEKYDIFFVEHFDMCGVGLVEVIKPRSLISVAASTAFGPQLEEFGIPKALSYDTALYVSKMDVHSIYDRIVNILGDIAVRLSFDQMRTALHAVFVEKYGANFPSLIQISSNSAYVFTNTEPLIDFAVPTINKVIAVGGIGAKEPKKLSEDWEKILSKREKTVLLSFGSVAKSAYLPMKVKHSIIETIKALPHVTFIWKYEVDDDFTRDYASKINNLELTKWMPQVDLLGSSKLSLFITHGGMGSTQETALRGVPGIFIPIFGDQPRNAGMMEHNRLGKVLDKNEVVDSAKFVAVIKEVLEDSSYAENARRVSAMLHKRPFTAKEQLIKYTEFAAEFGPSKALRPQSHDMNWIEYHNVDIIIAGIVVALISTVIALKIAQKVICRIFRVGKSKKEMLRWLRILLIGLTSVDSYKILVYNSAFAHSHSNFMGRIADILVEAGHNVTTLVSVMDPEVAYGTKLSKVIKVPASEATTNMYSQITKTQADFFGDNSFDPIGAYHRGQFYSSLIATQCRAVLDEPGLVEKLTAETYDVYFAEHFDMCGIALSELIKPISIISVASTIAFGPQLEEFGIPATLSYDPCLYVSKLDVHSMWDRLMNIFGDFVVRTSYTQLRSAIHALFKEKFGSNFPSMAQIASHSAYVFTNTEPLIDFAVPTISKDWEKILAKRPKTVLLSFGTISLAVDLPFEVKKSIVDTVKALPNVTFIWKYEKDDDFTRDYASKIENLELTKWMPQFDLLSHGNLSAFITHGGMGSTYDIALSGVPGIFIPLTGDQPRNSGMMEHNGFGKVFDKNDITDPAKLVAVIRHVLENESYRSNARRISAMLHKRPFTAKEKLIKHTEFAAEFGPSKALKPQSHDMNWIEYHNADIIIAGTGIALGVAVITLMIAKRIIRRIMHLLRSQ